jgi:hypothetical protein
MAVSWQNREGCPWNQEISIAQPCQFIAIQLHASPAKRTGRCTGQLTKHWLETQNPDQQQELVFQPAMVCNSAKIGQKQGGAKTVCLAEPRWRMVSIDDAGPQTPMRPTEQAAFA